MSESGLGSPAMWTRPGQVRPDLRIYAIGDVHGHADLLGKLATQIAADLASKPVAEFVTVLIGDYIDRGPASSAVIERLLRRDFPTPIITLRGNHEQMLLDGLADSQELKNWLFNGGVETLTSYGIGHVDRQDSDAERLRRTLLDALPASHLDFLHATELSRAIDGYFFCHAGIQPGVALSQQSPDVLMWIRAPFHLSKADHGKVVVHGHTPVRKPESLPNRINIDTGAFKSGRLTCLVLEGEDRRFLHTG